MNLLNINNLHASIGEEKILNGLSLKINPGETHAIMGPNGSGKSTLSYILSGKQDYNILNGSVTLKKKNLLDLDADERSRLGLFLAFQYPVELPGVTGMTFLRTIINSSRLSKGLPELDGIELVKLVKEKAANLNIPQEMLKRFVNVGFSGGEKKRFEILQMLILEPKLIILDETDSGLDIDALKIVSEGINNYKNKDTAFLLITHYHRILNFMNPDFVHILMNGRIVKSGDQNLAKEVEDRGYSWIEEELISKVS